MGLARGNIKWYSKNNLYRGGEVANGKENGF